MPDKKIRKVFSQLASLASSGKWHKRSIFSYGNYLTTSQMSTMMQPELINQFTNPENHVTVDCPNCHRQNHWQNYDSVKTCVFCDAYCGSTPPVHVFFDANGNKVQVGRLYVFRSDFLQKDRLVSGVFTSQEKFVEALDSARDTLLEMGIDPDTVEPFADWWPITDAESLKRVEMLKAGFKTLARVREL